MRKEYLQQCAADWMDMRFQKSVCLLLGVLMLTAVGCDGNSSTTSQKETEKITETYQEVNIFYGESASFGDMTVTVKKVEDPGITMKNSKKMAVFFEVTIDNGTKETVTTNYLNNFALTVDDTFYDSADCFTIPVMKELYDLYGNEAFADEIPAGQTSSGYLAAEVDPDFESLQLHYIPKTTDRGSRITVSLSRENMTEIKK